MNNAQNTFLRVKIINSDNVLEDDHGYKFTSEILNSKDSPQLSVARIRTVAHAEKEGLSTTSDQAYYVLEGDGYFIIEGKKHVVKKDDLIFLPANTSYKESAGLKLLAIASPRFDHKNWKNK